MSQNQNPLFGALLAAVAVINGGCSVLAALTIREISLQSWAWYPVDEVRLLLIQFVVSATICFVTAFWWTYQQ